MKKSLSRPAKLSASILLFSLNTKLSNEEKSSAKKCPLEMKNKTVKPRETVCRAVLKVSVEMKKSLSGPAKMSANVLLFSLKSNLPNEEKSSA